MKSGDSGETRIAVVRPLLAVARCTKGPARRVRARGKRAGGVKSSRCVTARRDGARSRPRHVRRERRRAEVLGGEVEARRREQAREVHARDLEREVDPRVLKAPVDTQPAHAVDGPGHDQQSVGDERALARTDRDVGVQVDVGRRAERSLLAAGPARLAERRDGETARLALHDRAHDVLLLLDARLAVERPGIEHRAAAQQDAHDPGKRGVRGAGVRRRLRRGTSRSADRALPRRPSAPAAARVPAARSPNSRAPRRPGRPPAGSRPAPRPRRWRPGRSARAARGAAAGRGRASRSGRADPRAGPHAARA